MAITRFLLQSTSRLHQLRSYPPKLSTSHAINPLIKNYSTCCIEPASPRYYTKFFNMSHQPAWEKINIEKYATKTGINRVISRSIENAIKAVRMPLITVAYDDHHCHLAFASSGGRMGGHSSSKSSSPSKSSSSSNSVYKTPPVYRTPSYYDHGRSPSYYNDSGRYRTQPPSNNGSDSDFWFIVIYIGIIFAVTFLCLLLLVDADSETSASETSVLKLQVGALGMGRTLQRDLNLIADSADTSTPEGLNKVLQESIRTLLRHSDQCISGYSYVDVKSGVKEGEKRFDQLSIEERDKFNEESLVNVDNMKKKSSTSQISDGKYNKYIVVTIIVAARGGARKLPPIKSSEQLKEALEKLTSISSNNIVAVEVLWTPQKEEDSLTEQEMLRDYPLLHPIYSGLQITFDF